MAKAPKFGTDADFAKHVGQPAHIAHQGKDSFFVKGGFITYSAGAGDVGKPIKLGADGLLDTSLLPAVAPELHAASHEYGASDALGGVIGVGGVAWATNEYAGATIPNVTLISFAVETTASATTDNDYIEVARIEMSGNYSGGWVRINGLSGSDNRENHPVEIDVQGSNDGSGVAQTPVITYRGRPSGHNFFVYLESNGGGAGIHYYHIYYKSINAWNSLNGTILGRVASTTNCEITVWQTGNNVGESTPTGTLYQANNWWGVMDEFRVYDADLTDFGRIYVEDGGFFIKSISDPLYLNHSTVQNIYCFANISSGNPEFRWYGWDSGASAVKYGSAYVSSDGAAWIKGEEYLRLCAMGNYVDVVPNNASYGMVIRKHDAAGAVGSPFVNFFVEDATVDYLNIVLGAVGSTLGLVIDDNDNVGVGKVATAGYKLDANGVIRGTQLYSTVAIGTAPLIVISTTKCANLNADMLDGYHSSSFYQWVWKTSNTTLSLTTGGVWYNYDFTSITSANCVAVILAWKGNVTSDAHKADIEWRRDGNSNTIAYMQVGGLNSLQVGGQVIVEVDPSTEIAEYKFNKNLYAYINVYLVGYIEKI